MMEFTIYPDGYWPHFRSPRWVKDTPMRGWDVYALQTAVGEGIALDGIFGQETDLYARAYQEEAGLFVDGVVGPVTQRSLALGYARAWTRELGIVRRLLTGQLSFESSCLLGNQSPVRPNGSADCGVAQRNNEHTPTIEGFNVPQSVEALARQVASKYAEYSDYNVVNDRRCWELASGSWNAPAWTDKLARGGSLTDEQRDHVEHYISEATALVRW